MSDDNYTQKANETVEKMPSLKEGACLMSVQVTGSCGEATLPKASTLLEGEEITSELVKGTTLQWFPKDELRFANRSLQRVNRLLASKGVSFGKGLTMIPLCIAKSVQKEIDQMKDEFILDLDMLVTRFTEVVEDHKQQHPDISSLIDAYQLDVDDFRSRFIFKLFPPMAVQPLYEEDEEEMRSNITQTLFEEVSADADKLVKGSFLGKEQVTQKAITAIKKLRTKLVNLAFLDKGIFNVVNSIDQALENLPLTGPVYGLKFHRLANYLQNISSDENLRLIASGDLSEETEEVEETLETQVAQETEVQSQDAFDGNIEQEMSEQGDLVTAPAPSQDVNIPPVTGIAATEEANVPSCTKTHAAESVSVFDTEFDFGGF